MKFKVPVTVLTTSTERFSDQTGKEVEYGLYVCQGEADMLIRGTCSAELVGALNQLRGAEAKLVYELRTDNKFKPVLKLVDVE